MRAVKPPSGLGEAGVKFWREVTKQYTFRPDEARLLEDACREMDLIARLEDAIAKAPLMVRGSMGQEVANPLVQEVRQHRSVLARLLGGLKLPDEAGQKPTSEDRSATMRELAQKRWGKRGA